MLLKLGVQRLACSRMQHALVDRDTAIKRARDGVIEPDVRSAQLRTLAPLEDVRPRYVRHTVGLDERRQRVAEVIELNLSVLCLRQVRLEHDQHASVVGTELAATVLATECDTSLYLVSDEQIDARAKTEIGIRVAKQLTFVANLGECPIHDTKVRNVRVVRLHVLVNTLGDT